MDIRCNIIESIVNLSIFNHQACDTFNGQCSKDSASLFEMSSACHKPQEGVHRSVPSCASTVTTILYNCVRSYKQPYRYLNLNQKNPFFKTSFRNPSTTKQNHIIVSVRSQLHTTDTAREGIFTKNTKPRSTTGPK